MPVFLDNIKASQLVAPIPITELDDTVRPGRNYVAPDDINFQNNSTNGWSVIDGWSIANNTYTHTAAAAVAKYQHQYFNEIPKLYLGTWQATYTLTTTTQGFMRVLCFNDAVTSLTERLVAGPTVVTETFDVSSVTNSWIGIKTDADWAGSIQNISVRPLAAGNGYMADNVLNGTYVLTAPLGGQEIGLPVIHHRMADTLAYPVRRIRIINLGSAACTLTPQGYEKFVEGNDQIFADAGKKLTLGAGNSVVLESTDDLLSENVGWIRRI
jgi:hypothetical protein